MRSFAAMAGFAAAAHAHYGYPTYNTTTDTTVAISSTTGPIPSTTEPVVESSSALAESSSAPLLTQTTIEIITGLTTVCPTATIATYGTNIYTVTASTTIIDDDCEWTTTYPVKPTTTVEVVVTPSAPLSTIEPSQSYPAPSNYSIPSASQAPPPSDTPIPTSPGPKLPYPSANVTIPIATGALPPNSTVPPTSEFTGAAAQAGVGLLAVVGAIAAFL